MDQPKPKNADQDQIGSDDIVEETRGKQNQHACQERGEWLKVGDVQGQAKSTDGSVRPSARQPLRSSRILYTSDRSAMLEFEHDGEIIVVDVTTAVVKARNTSIIATVPVALSAPSRVILPMSPVSRFRYDWAKRD